MSYEMLHNAVKNGNRLLPNQPRRWLSKYGSLNPCYKLECSSNRGLIKEYRWLLNNAKSKLNNKKIMGSSQVVHICHYPISNVT